MAMPVALAPPGPLTARSARVIDVLDRLTPPFTVVVPERDEVRSRSPLDRHAVGRVRPNDP